MNPNRALWEKGDFTRIAATMRVSGRQLVEGLGLVRGMDVLDLGCGECTTALPAAEPSGKLRPALARAGFSDEIPGGGRSRPTTPARDAGPALDLWRCRNSQTSIALGIAVAPETIDARTYHLDRA